MKKSILLIILLFIIVYPSSAQETYNPIPKWMVEANAGFRFTPNGNTLGLLIALDKPFWSNNKNNLSLDVAMQGTYTLGLEGGFEGTYGTTSNTGIHILFGTSVYLLKSKRLILRPQVYCGWSYKSTNMGIDNEALNISQSYTDTYHYLSRGIFIQSGYALNQDLILSAFIKTDLRRLTDGDGILEYPEILYGIGIIKTLKP